MGVIGPDGSVGFLGEPMEIDAEFVKRATKIGTPENRFRFTNPCAESGCSNWTGSRCGVADRILRELEEAEPPDQLPACGIRPWCRWHKQSGAEACSACRFVITNTLDQTEA